jgi:hypothetical protein
MNSSNQPTTNQPPTHQERNTVDIKTTSINLPLSTEQASLLLTVLNQQITTLQQRHDESHSGVDRLLINSAIIGVTELRDHARSRVPVPMPDATEYDLPEVEG